MVGDLGGGSLELVDVHGTRARRGLDAAARRSCPGRHFLQVAQESRKIREENARLFADAQRMQGPHAFTPSAARGERWHGCTCGKPDIRCTSCTATPSPPTRRSSSPDWCIGSNVKTLSNIEVVENARRPLLPYAALVLEHMLRIGKPRQIVFSALGVREGLLYSLLKKKEKRRRTRSSKRRAISTMLRSRSPRHGEELIDWTDRFMASSGLDEAGRGAPASSRRMSAGRYWLACASGLPRRTVAQYHRLWRVHRHRSSRPRLSGARRVLSPRRIGRLTTSLSPRLRELASTRMIDRARVHGAAMRLAYVISAAMPGVLPKTPLARRAAPARTAASRPNSPRSAVSGCLAGCGRCLG